MEKIRSHEKKFKYIFLKYNVHNNINYTDVTLFIYSLFPLTHLLPVTLIYPLKRSEHLTVLSYFLGVQKSKIENKWVKENFSNPKVNCNRMLLNKRLKLRSGGEVFRLESRSLVSNTLRYKFFQMKISSLH